MIIRIKGHSDIFTEESIEIDNGDVKISITPGVFPDPSTMEFNRDELHLRTFRDKLVIVPSASNAVRIRTTE